MQARCIQDRNRIKLFEVRGSPLCAIVIDRQFECTRFPFDQFEHLFPDQTGVMLKTVAQAVHQKFAVMLGLDRQFSWNGRFHFF